MTTVEMTPRASNAANEIPVTPFRSVSSTDFGEMSMRGQENFIEVVGKGGCVLDLGGPPIVSKRHRVPPANIQRKQAAG